MKNIKRLALILRLKLFIIGSVLGMCTSFPELSLAINATLNNVPMVAVGNLLGGIFYVLGFVLAIGVILNGKVNTDGKIQHMLFQAIVLFIPALLGLDGEYGVFDGVIMVSLYSGVVYYMSKEDAGYLSPAKAKKRYSIVRILFVAAVGLALILLISKFILMITIDLLKQFNVSELILGIIVFSVGTNLPEITIIIISWYRKIPELSLSHLVGSCLANVPILGCMAIAKPIHFTPDYAFKILTFFMALLIMLFTSFYLSQRQIKRQEGFVLLVVYMIFLVVNFVSHIAHV